jgi:hypothetical protein
MKTNKATVSGHKKRKYKRTKSRTGPVFPWKILGYGRFALCLISLIAEEKVQPGDTYSRTFRATGLTDKWLYARLTELMPALSMAYKINRGCDLTASIVYNRWHKMVYQTEPGAGNSYTVGASDEHPLNHPDLQPLLQYVEPLYKRGKPVTCVEVARACHAAGMNYTENP